MMQVAIAHDYLTQRGGAERVVLEMAKAFPDAAIYTTLYHPEGTYDEFKSREIYTSPLNRIGVLRRNHRFALPLLAWACRHVRPDADVVLVSSSGWAHAFRARGKSIVYCYTPARWLYQTDVYLSAWPRALRRLAHFSLSPLRRWDRRHARMATRYIAISRVTQTRILEEYNRGSMVLPAPLSIKSDEATKEPTSLTGLVRPGNYFLCVSRLLSYKNVDVVVEACEEVGAQLVVVGRGPDADRLKAIDAKAVFLSDLDDAEVRWLLQNCKAAVSASFEDFGLAPLEAAAYGKPSIVLRWGGFLDTVKEGSTGLFFDAPTATSLAEALRVSESVLWDEKVIVEHSKTFAADHFRSRLQQIVADLDLL